MAFGGLGLTLAGFAGLISALDRSPGSRSPIAAYRVRNIVLVGFWLTFTGPGTVALYGATSDLILAVRCGTAFLGLGLVRGLVLETRRGPAWPDERQRRMAVLIAVVMVGVGIPNLVIGSAGYLQLLMIMGLFAPVTIFYNTIRASTTPEAVESETGAESKLT